MNKNQQNMPKKKIVVILCVVLMISLLLGVFIWLICRGNCNRYSLEKRTEISEDINVNINNGTKEIIYTPETSGLFRISDIIKLVTSNKNIEIHGVDNVLSLHPDFTETTFEVVYKDKKVLATYKLKIDYANILFVYSENGYLGCLGKNDLTKQENKIRYINESFDIDIAPLFFSDEGYTKPIDIENDDVVKKLEKIYVIGKQNEYTGTINYYMQGTTTKVPGIEPNPSSVTGYIGQVINIEAPVAPSGYKVSAGNPTTITIKSDNSAVVNLYYEIDSAQTFTHTIYYYLNNTENTVPGIERNRDEVTGAIGYSATVNYPTAPAGYKLVNTSETSVVVTIASASNTSSIVYYEVFINEKVFLGGRHTAILKTDGSIYMCGYNTYGQLGLGDTTNRTTPTLLPSASYLQ